MERQSEWYRDCDRFQVPLSPNREETSNADPEIM